MLVSNIASSMLTNISGELLIKIGLIWSYLLEFQMRQVSAPVDYTLTSKLPVKLTLICTIP